jgi:rsbT co-antagonist protein RsbR
MEQTASPDEVAALRRRIAELEARIDVLTRSERELERQASAQRALLEALPVLVYIKDRQHRYMQVNQACALAMGVEAADVIGKSDAEIYPPDEARTYMADDEAVMAAGAPRDGIEEPIPDGEGGVRWVVSYKAPFFDGGLVAGMVGLSIDITDRKAAEQALHGSQAELRETIDRQEVLIETIHELSTPVIPVYDGVLVLPLVGSVDSARSQQIMEALLESTQRERADTIIIDVTGVRVVDTAVANHLLQAARAAGLLGARCMLVGIAPEIAQTIVQLGVDLSMIETAPSLEIGFVQALARRGLAITAKQARR